MIKITESEAYGENLHVTKKEHSSTRAIFNTIPGRTDQEKLVTFLLSIEFNPDEIIALFKNPPCRRSIYTIKKSICTNSIIQDNDL
jgi:hypothetical protein